MTMTVGSLGVDRQVGVFSRSGLFADADRRAECLGYRLTSQSGDVIGQSSRAAPLLVLTSGSHSRAVQHGIQIRKVRKQLSVLRIPLRYHREKGTDYRVPSP